MRVRVFAHYKLKIESLFSPLYVDFLKLHKLGVLQMYRIYMYLIYFVQKDMLLSQSILCSSVFELFNFD